MQTDISVCYRVPGCLESERAAIRLAVKKELRGKVRISELNNIMAEIMEQAEGQYREWPNVVAV